MCGDVYADASADASLDVSADSSSDASADASADVLGRISCKIFQWLSRRLWLEHCGTEAATGY